jgi:hypothetical protein
MTDTDKFVSVDMGIGQRITSRAINKIKKVGADDWYITSEYSFWEIIVFGDVGTCASREDLFTGVISERWAGRCSLC